MRRGRSIQKAVAAVTIPLVLACCQQAWGDGVYDSLARPADAAAAPPLKLGGERVELAQLRRPGLPGRAATPPPATEPSAPGGATAAAEEARVLPTMPADMTPRPVLPPMTPSAPGYVGFANPSPVPGGDFLPIPDRWRIGQPTGSGPGTRGNVFNPYNQNVLKGDYPVLGTQDIFFILGVTSDTLLEARRLQVPSGTSTLNPRNFDFFGNAESQVVSESLIVSAELFKGNVAYKPKDWVLRATAVLNANYVHANELNLLRPDIREGRDRIDNQFAMQELFYEQHLADVSANYDFVSVRVGIQSFNSDFRGFLFSDNEPGVRLFGTLDNNRWQYNVAFFNQVEKDTNSGLNEFNFRHQQIFLANLFRQDFLIPGYTAQVSFHANLDGSGIQYDENGFLVRPIPSGTVLPAPRDTKAYYLGWAGDGRLGRFNITHQFYQVFGQEEFNSISGRATTINAQFFAVELSYDQDYIRYRASFEYASGDHNPRDGAANGFDSIFDNPNFAGGGLSFFTRQAIALTGSGTGLTGRFSTLPDLRTSKEQGQANFVNPGLLLFNLGMDIDITPKLKLITNASYLRFDDTASIRLLLQDDKIGRDIGFDIGAGIEYRPLLNNNIIISAGVAALVPGQGFKDIYTGDTLYSTFFGVTLTY